MKDLIICPFYGQSDDYCDVGCGYISPHDVSMIIKFCSCHYSECVKFRELYERYPTGLPMPLAQNIPCVSDSMRYQEVPMKQTVNHHALSIQDTTANPAPLGLLGFGMTTVLLNLHNAGFFPLDAMILGMGIFYGGLGQIIVGMMEWKKNNTFGATAFTSYGLFWLTLVALILLPRTGLIPPSSATAMGSYLTMWGLFTAVLFLATFQLNRALQVVFGSLMVLFFLLAAADFSGNDHVRIIAGYEGIFCGLAAIYTGLAQVVNEVFKRTIAPLGAVRS